MYALQTHENHNTVSCRRIVHGNQNTVHSHKVHGVNCQIPLFRGMLLGTANIHEFYSQLSSLEVLFTSSFEGWIQQCFLRLGLIVDFGKVYCAFLPIHSTLVLGSGK